MRRKEIAEIRKQFSLENCNITRIDTSLITQGEITTRSERLAVLHEKTRYPK